MSKQTKTNIDTTINKFNRLFLLSFENEDGRTSFSKYYTPSVELKYFDVLTDSKSFFDVPIEIKEETYEKIIEMNKNNDYTTFQIITSWLQIDLNKQIELKKLDLKQQINFTSKLEEDNGAMMLLIIEKSEKTTFNFHKIL